jgi:heptosyltransferase-1
MRVVLVRLSALGDIIHTWPLAEAIRQAEPSIHLTWVVESPFRPLVDGHPAVDSVITVRTGAWRRRPLAAQTRAEISLLKGSFHELQPSLAIDAQGLLKSALITRWTGAPRRAGLARPWRRELLAGIAYSEKVPGAPLGTHVAATNLELVRAVGIQPPDLTPPDGRWLLAPDEASAGPDGPYAVLLPGAGGAHKVMDVSTLAAVGRDLARTGFEVIVAWGPGEEERAEAVATLAGDGVRPAPPTDLLELAALMSRARVVIGGDTGPVHLAASLDVPTLGVFLASDWRRNGPLGSRTAVVTGAQELRDAPSGTARTRLDRAVGADEIISATRRLLETHG